MDDEDGAFGGEFHADDLEFTAARVDTPIHISLSGLSRVGSPAFTNGSGSADAVLPRAARELDLN